VIEIVRCEEPVERAQRQLPYLIGERAIRVLINYRDSIPLGVVIRVVIGMLDV
jgi:hypothetical protein